VSPRSRGTRPASTRTAQPSSPPRRLEMSHPEARGCSTPTCVPAPREGRNRPPAPPLPNPPLRAPSDPDRGRPTCIRSSQGCALRSCRIRGTPSRGNPNGPERTRRCAERRRSLRLGRHRSRMSRPGRSWLQAHATG
jgi:hypothetical protein